ncbi:MAG TPA: hypothetical protein V6D47_00265 [Oscillatoriaceae cyanobacterium]
MTQIRGNQPSFVSPSTEKAIVQKVEAMAKAEGGSKQAMKKALHEVLNEVGANGKARSALKLEALRDLKKSHRVLDSHFAGHSAPKPVAPPTRAS